MYPEEPLQPPRRLSASLPRTVSQPRVTNQESHHHTATHINTTRPISRIDTPIGTQTGLSQGAPGLHVLSPRTGTISPLLQSNTSFSCST
jgi:hypothetical protein